MRKTIHIFSGYLTALSFLLSFFLMAGLDGDYSYYMLKLLLIVFIHTFVWCIVYYFTSAN